ncbi:MAG: hypothetical protein KY456_11265 [Chloroflexi bacterium]|nr:hypothetical protein [Chloroflexota bacterium]
MDGHSVTDSFRVVIGNEPRFYREALAGALRLLRPDVEVVLAETAALDDEVGRRGGLVVCSRLSPTIQTQAPTWILLYPEAENRAVVGLAGRERSIPSVEIADLLGVIDEAERLAHD